MSFTPILGITRKYIARLFGKTVFDFGVTHTRHPVEVQLRGWIYHFIDDTPPGV